MKYSPVVVFTYNRPRHAAETLRALAANTLATQTPLIIYSDAAKNEADTPLVEQVRAYLKTVRGFASITIHERECNFGLAESISDGVTSAIQKHRRVIVLEDDIVTSPHFLDYMNTAINRYADEERVMHVAAHMPPVSPNGLPESFFLRQSSCWGWGTWARAWKHYHRRGKEFIEAFTPADIRRFNLDGAYDYWRQLLANESGGLKTWAVYWYASIFSKRGLCLHPRQSLVQNIGFDGSGENCGVGANGLSVADAPAPGSYPEIVTENARAMRCYQRHLRGERAHGFFQHVIDILARKRHA